MKAIDTRARLLTVVGMADKAGTFLMSSRNETKHRWETKCAWYRQMKQRTC